MYGYFDVRRDNSTRWRLRKCSLRDLTDLTAFFDSRCREVFLAFAPCPQLSTVLPFGKPFPLPSLET